MPLLFSICIPVYNSERFLEECLESVLSQEYKNFEIVICNDCSSGKNEKGWGCRKIVSKIKKSAKKSGIKINYFEHSNNIGIIETRRDLFLASTGDYILYVDSDDVLTPGAFDSFYQTILKTNAQIVHAQSKSFYVKNGEKIFVDDKKNNVKISSFSGSDVFEQFMGERAFSSFLWGKMINRELFQKAFEIIPYTFCTVAEDLLIVFFVTYFASSYVGIEHVSYLYRLTSGITSVITIDNPKRWSLVCSTASVFTIIYSWIDQMSEENGVSPVSEKVYREIQKSAVFYLKNNLEQMYGSVSKDFLPEARQMLNQFWGESFVNTIDKKFFADSKN